MKTIDYAKIDTRSTTTLVEILDAAIGLLLLLAFLVMGAGMLYMLG